MNYHKETPSGENIIYYLVKHTRLGNNKCSARRLLEGQLHITQTSQLSSQWCVLQRLTPRNTRADTH